MPFTEKAIKTSCVCENSPGCSRQCQWVVDTDEGRQCSSGGRMIQSVCGYQVSEVILYTFLCSIFYLHWLMAPASHVCNKCCSVLYFLCSVVFSAQTVWVTVLLQKVFYFSPVDAPVCLMAIIVPYEIVFWILKCVLALITHFIISVALHKNSHPRFICLASL